MSAPPCLPPLQLTSLAEGACLLQLEELLLGSSPQLLPTALPLLLLQTRRLRRLGLPAWWQQAGTAELSRVLLQHMPWLVLEHC